MPVRCNIFRTIFEAKKRNQSQVPRFASEPASHIKSLRSSTLRRPALLIKIMAAILEILHCAVVARTGKVFQAQISPQHHLGIRRRVGGNTIASKREIARRQNATLRILDIEIVDSWEVADVA